MTLEDETCDYCGGQVDSIGGDLAIARKVGDVWRLWCSTEHLVEWARARAAKNPRWKAT